MSVSGTNARVTIQSNDSSTNISNATNIFSEIRSALETDGMSFEKLIEIDTRLAEMQAAKDKSSFAKAYQSFIGVVADHIGIVAPFLPAITATMATLS